MDESAKTASSRPLTTAERIVECAQQLCLERGYSGFTLDDLAEAAGVSRRTLFNHVKDKDHAVFGPSLGLEDSDVEELRAGGPTGDLLLDMLHAMETRLGTRPKVAQNFNRVTELVCEHPELGARFLALLEAEFAAVTAHLLARPGETQDRAELALAALFGIFRQAAHTAVEHGTPFTEALQRSSATFLQLVRPGATTTTIETEL